MRYGTVSIRGICSTVTRQRKIIPLAIALALLLLTTTAQPLVHAITYTGSLPNNTIYADDFENYTTGTSLTPPWYIFDNGGTPTAPKNANVTAQRFFTGGHSLVVQGPSNPVSGCTPGVNCKWDINRNFAQAGVTQVTLSLWFAFSESIKQGGLSGQDTWHFSVEWWDNSNTTRYECPFQPYPGGQGEQIIENHAFSPIRTSNLNLTAYDQAGVGTISNEVWHYYTSTDNIGANKCVRWQVDDRVFTPTTFVGGTDTGARPIADTAFGTATKAFRFEIGLITNTANTQPWYLYVDNILIQDTSPGQPNIIQFGITTASGLFQLIMAATGIMYTSSAIGTVMRVFAHGRGPKFMASPKLIIVTGIVGTVGFLFMLVIGANLVGPACPHGAICNG